MATLSLNPPATPKADHVVLTIAGSDPSGGAGIQADLKTFAAHGCYGTSVITALTAQNTTGVQGVCAVPPSFVEEQIYSVLDDLRINSIKTGMLYDEATVKAVVSALHNCFPKKDGKHALPPLVCDPVCVSTSGHALLQEGAMRTLTDDLFPLSVLITPNKSETELLLRAPWRKPDASNQPEVTIKTLVDLFEASKTLLGAYKIQAVLLKGGHLTTNMDEIKQLVQLYPSAKLVLQNMYGENMEILAANYPRPAVQGEMVLDLLSQKDGRHTVFARPKIATPSIETHGRGCTLSSAIASELGKGLNLEDAVAKATVYTNFGVRHARPIGNGNGPLNHLHCAAEIMVPRRAPTIPYPLTQLLIEASAKDWKGYVEHEFVKQLGKGTLSQECFIQFIRQGYIYLKYYSRAYGLLIAKTTSYVGFESSTQTILETIKAVSTNINICAAHGISAEELDQTPEHIATTAYGAYLIDVALRGDPTSLFMSLMVCLLGYGEVGLWLKKEARNPNSWVVIEGNPYWSWIEDYAGGEYQSAVRLGLETVEKCAEVDPPSSARLRGWKEVWTRCTKLEKAFWDTALSVRKMEALSLA